MDHIKYILYNMANPKQIQIITPPNRDIYDDLCNTIREEHQDEYLLHDEDGNIDFNICALMNILVQKLKPPVNIAYVNHLKFTEIVPGSRIFDPGPGIFFFGGHSNIANSIYCFDLSFEYD